MCLSAEGASFLAAPGVARPVPPDGDRAAAAAARGERGRAVGDAVQRRVLRPPDPIGRVDEVVVVRRVLVPTAVGSALEEEQAHAVAALSPGAGQVACERGRRPEVAEVGREERPVRARDARAPEEVVHADHPAQAPGVLAVPIGLRRERCPPRAARHVEKEGGVRRPRGVRPVRGERVGLPVAQLLKLGVDLEPILLPRADQGAVEGRGQRCGPRLGSPFLGQRRADEHGDDDHGTLHLDLWTGMQGGCRRRLWKGAYVSQAGCLLSRI